MKKIILIIFFAGAFLFGGCSFNQDNQSYLRIHIRANSNSEQDQSIKYEVKNLCVEYLSEYVKECKSKDEVVTMLNKQIPQLEDVIDEFLEEKNFKYKSNIQINNEFFPTRTYDDLTLDADYYDALIVNLGSGTGNNWWCVIYPPLCFSSNNSIVYKSKIMELLKKI